MTLGYMKPMIETPIPRSSACATNALAGLHYDPARSVISYVTAHSAAAPDKVALRCGARLLSYSDLDRLSSGLAAHLNGLGIARGDVVALLAPRGIDAIIAMLAVLKLGAIYAPVDPTGPEAYVTATLACCNPAVILGADRATGPLAARARPGTPCLDLAAVIRSLETTDAPAIPASKTFPPCDADGGTAACIMFTSGSTGPPKGVVVPNRAIARVVLDQAYVDLSASDVVLHAASICFDASTFEIWGALLNGATLVIMPEFGCSLSELHRIIARENVSVAWMTVGLFHLFYETADARALPLRHLIFGGDVALPDVVRRFQRAQPHLRLTNGYGPTESTVFATAWQVPPDFAGGPLPIGSAIAHTGVHILDANLRPLPDGQEGEIVVSGDGLALGYIGGTEAQNARFVYAALQEGQSPTRCYLTGDRGLREADGTVHFRGRLDRQVKIDGKRVELDQLEAFIAGQTDITAAALVAARQSAARTEIIAIFKPAPGRDHQDDALVITALRQRIAAQLPAQFMPRHCLVSRAFALNRSGKVDGKEMLRRAEVQLDAPGGDGAMPRIACLSPRRMVAAIWCDVLGVDDLDPDANFFDVGGSSLSLLRIHALLERSFARPIPVTVLFRRPTIRSLSEFLSDRLDSTSGGKPSAPFAHAAQVLQ